MLLTVLLTLLHLPAAHAEPPAAPASAAITALCDDSFEGAMAELGSGAGLVMFVATEYTLSQRQVEAFEAFSAQQQADGVRLFTVEANQCSRVIVSQRISRVPAAVLYQDGAKLGEVSSLTEPIAGEQLAALVGKLRTDPCPEDCESCPR